MDLLSRYRNELFGIAAMGTVISHANYFVMNDIPSIVQKILAYGGTGVYIFALLSGMGLYFSLTSKDVFQNKTTVVDFYKKRFTRVIIPYVLIVGLWYAIKYLVCLNEPIGFFYELTTLSFWIEHSGAWYVAMLIPVYVFFPYYYMWVERGNRLIRTSIAFSVILILSILLSVFNGSLYKHLSGVLCSFMIVILGNYIGKSVKEKSFKGRALATFAILLFVAKMFVKPYILSEWLNSFSYAFLGIAFSIVGAEVLDKLKCGVINDILSFLGKHSLELYLTNLIWIQFFQFFGIEKVFSNNGIIVYLIIIVLGLISSVFFKKVETVLIKRLKLI